MASKALQINLPTPHNEVYLPFTKPFSSRENIGVSDLVLEAKTPGWVRDKLREEQPSYQQFLFD